MKGKVKIIMGAAACLAVASCTQELVPRPEGAVRITATREGFVGTKTDIGSAEGSYLLWSAGDKIAVVNGGSVSEYTLTAGAGTKTATFSGDVELQTGDLYAYYPCGGSYKDAVPVELGSQSLKSTEGTGKYYYMVAYAEVNDPDNMSVVFTNPLSAFVFNIENGLDEKIVPKKLTVTAPEAVFYQKGSISLSKENAANPEVASPSDAVNTVSVTLDGFTLESGESASYPAVVMPVDLSGKDLDFALTYSKGDSSAELTVTLTGIEGKNLSRNSFAGINFKLSDSSIDTGFEDMKNAFENGNSYTLESDIDITSATITVPAGKNVTLDLNGHEIKAANTSSGQIKVYGSLTIKDAAGNGRIYSSSDYSDDAGTALITAEGESARITLESGTVYAVRDDAVNKGQSAVGVLDGGDFTMNGGEIEAGWYAVSGNGTDQQTSSTITISGGELSSTADYAIYLPHNGVTTISGGTVTGGAGAVGMRSGKLVIKDRATLVSLGTSSTGQWSDGTSGMDCAVVFVDPKTSSSAYGDCNVTVDGGTFDARGTSLSIIANENSAHDVSITVNGGTFSDASVLPYVAENGNVTISLADDTELEKSMVVERGSATVDLNKHTLTAASTAVVEGTPQKGQTVAIFVNDGAKLTVRDGKIGDSTQGPFYGVFGKGKSEITLGRVEFSEMVTYAYNGAGARLDADNCTFRGWLSGWGSGSAAFDACTFTIGKAWAPATICYGNTTFTSCSFADVGRDADYWANGVEVDEKTHEYTGPDNDGYYRWNYVVTGCSPATAIAFNGCKFVDEDGTNVGAVTVNNHPYHKCSGDSGWGDGTISDAKVTVDGQVVTSYCSGYNAAHPSE